MPTSKPRRSAYEIAELGDQFCRLKTRTKPQPTDYGTGELYTSVEVHTLSHIEEHPGITATDIARATLRTKGAVSPVIARLEENGLIRRQRDEHNAKLYRLYVTEKGAELSRCHKRFDEAVFSPLFAELTQRFGADAVDLYGDVMAFFIEKLQNPSPEEE